VSPLAFIPPPPTEGWKVGPVFIHIYGLCIAIGILAAVSLARRRWQDTGRDPVELEVPMVWGVVAGFIGARIAYVSTHLDQFRGRWLHVVAIWEGGIALYGGLTLGILVGVLVARRRGLPVVAALDAAIPGIPLAQAFGRWGNYFNQELFGTPTSLPWALEVERDFRPERYAEFATFHPTFLYESLYNLLVVFLLLRISATRRLRTGSLVLVYGILYGSGRFLLELLRTDTEWRFLGLSRNAYVSLAVVLGSALLLALRERRGAAAGGASGTGGGEPGSGGDGDAGAPVPAAPAPTPAGTATGTTAEDATGEGPPRPSTA
jgi:prolipoprotein diacylglyceryl transferase